MKCAVAIVLALIGLVVSNPVPPLSYGLVAHAPVVLPSAVSASSSVINHGITLPHAIPIVSTPIISAPVYKTHVVAAPVGLGWGGLGWGKGYGGLGWGDWGWGKGWH